MPRTEADSASPVRLSREIVLSAAMDLADSQGWSALTIRNIARELGSKPMSLYHYVASKDELVDELVDRVFEQIELPTPGDDWRKQMTRRSESARAVLRRHRWAIGLLESRTAPGPANLRHHDAVLATFRAAGFPPALTAHSYALLDSYVYGFALQEANLPFEGADGVQDIAGPIMEALAAGAYPDLAHMASTYYLRPGYDFADEFRYGLDLILDGLEQRFVAGSA